MINGYFSGQVGTLDQTAPGNNFSGQGLIEPAPVPPVGVPVAGSGFTPAPGAWAVQDLNQRLGLVALKVAPLLQPGMPEIIRVQALAAVTMLNAIQKGYIQQLAKSGGAAAWNRADVRNSLQLYRVALQHVSSAVDAMRQGLQGQPPAGASGPATIHWPGSTQGMGIFSWNPNLWGMTAEEAQAYELQQAQAQVKLEQAAAAATAANPGLLDTVKGALQTTAKAAASTSSLLMFVGVASAAALTYWLYKDPERGARAAGSLAQGGARAAGTFVGGAAKIATL